MKVKEIVLINPHDRLINKDFINYIDTSSVNDGVLQDVQYITSNFPSRAQREIKINDILISSVRPNLKHNYLVKVDKPNLVASTGFIHIRCSTNKVLPQYLYYFLSCDKRVNLYTMIANSSQTTFPSFNKEVIENLDLKEISIDIQQHIVDTIGSVDNLIEKNNELIGITHKYLDNKYEILSANIDKVRISELDYFNICKSGVKHFDNQKTYLDTSSVDQTNIVDDTYKVTYDNRPSRANMQPTINSIWFAKLKDSPKYILVKDNSKALLKNYIFSTGFLGLQSEEFLINYLYCLILSKDFNGQKNLLSNGATMQGINNEIFNDIKVPKLTKEQVKNFGKSIDDVVNLIIDLQNKNYQLKQMKSRLLQKYFD